MKFYFQFSALQLSVAAAALTALLPAPALHAGSALRTGAVAPQSEAAQVEADQAEESIEYANADFGFCAQLPAGWKDFSVTMSHWSSEPPGQAHSITGPMVRVRHPRWTSRDPHEDIPILVFTRAQWRLVQTGRIEVSSAATGPSELAHNAHYVFALPPRYNADMAEGYEEVEGLVSHGFLHTPCGTGKRGLARDLEHAAPPGSLPVAGSTLAGRQ